MGKRTETDAEMDTIDADELLRAIGANTTATERMASALSERVQLDREYMEMWCKTLKLSDERDKRNYKIVWALVLAIISLAGVEVLSLVGVI